MLVDRILAVEGEPRSMSAGRVVTEHDIRPGAWYLDGGRIPTSIAVESGQADLFLSAYLGIDFQTRGLAVYRLLDAAVTFHRSLPGPDEVIRYDIHIDRFFRQGDTHLFRFRFEGTVNGKPLLTMTNGCAGFFTAEELASGKGVVQTELDRRPMLGIQPDDAADLPPIAVEFYDDARIDALRRGDLAGCFGPLFKKLRLRDPLRIPDGRMKLVDRVVHLDPRGGRYGIGLIRAEADIHPDDWFLTCHFVDDQVMPGTLMYECCLHTLRIYLLRLGWVGEQDQVVYEPVPGVVSQLKCRGQVTAATRKVTYEVTLKERGYRPEPHALVDALMYADGKPIIEITNMSIRLSGLTREAIRAAWGTQRSVLFDTDRILAFAVGKPSEAFGEPYRVFDSERIIARLPGPPYQFLDRITRIDAEPWKMVAGGVIEAQYDVPADAWYFAADRQRVMPFAVLLEVALQPCGWLAAYAGSALTSPVDLSFRNLGGTADLRELVRPEAGTLTTTVRLARVSASGGMIIQEYDFVIRNGERVVYEGHTTFGFFSKSALAEQVGIRDARPYEPADGERMRGKHGPFPREAPFPDDRLRMLDRIGCFVPDGGPKGLGFLRATKQVDPAEWFFKAHFYQDPVCPGSLGLESLVQLLKFMAVERWRGGPGASFEAMLDRKHRWTYRGQVVPDNRQVTVQAVVTDCDDAVRQLTADGFLSVDERVIYRMNDFTLRMIDG
jgi:3-hydroxymyristoyl/3-hydroxydecanoyl-(acyl carrier protein) dehydratase